MTNEEQQKRLGDLVVAIETARSRIDQSGVSATLEVAEAGAEAAEAARRQWVAARRDLGRELRAQRRRRSLSRTRLAGSAGLGSPRLVEIEEGRGNPPNRSEIERILCALSS